MKTTEQNVWETPDHDDWAGLASRMRPFVNKVSERKDLTVRVTPDVGALTDPDRARSLVPGMFIPALGTIRFSANRILAPGVDEPGTIDPSYRADQCDFPAMMGVAAHEAGHAAHTRVTFPDGTDGRVCSWAMMLEEPRMEGQVLARRRELRSFMKISAKKLVTADGSLRFRAQPKIDPAESAFRCAVLLLGRWKAGVLSQGDVQRLREDIAAVITDEVLLELESALERAVVLADGDQDGLLAAAADVLALLDRSPGHEDEEEGDSEDEDEDGEQQGQGGGEPDQGEGSDGGQGQEQGSTTAGDHGDPSSDDGSAAGPAGTNQDGSANGNAQQMPCGSWTDGDLDGGLEPTDETPAVGGELDNEIADSAEDTTHQTAQAAAQELGEDSASKPVAPSARAQAEQAAERAARSEANRQWGRACGSTGAGTVYDEMAPSASVVEQARALTRVLRRNQARAVTRTTRATALPPGRMRMGAEVQRRAQIAANTVPTATPYRQTHRRETPNPPLLVGFAGDVSGSMGPWQMVTAELAWSLAQSTRHLDGKIAAVAWNTAPHMTMKPGQIPARVPVARCEGGSTGCPAAVAALDAALGLSYNEHAARVLVIVTDGAIGGSRAEVIARVRRLTAQGVAVLWVTPTPDLLCKEATNVVLASTTKFGAVIGAAISGVLAAA